MAAYSSGIRELMMSVADFPCARSTWRESAINTVKGPEGPGVGGRVSDLEPTSQMATSSSGTAWGAVGVRSLSESDKAEQNMAQSGHPINKV